MVEDKVVKIEDKYVLVWINMLQEYAKVAEWLEAFPKIEEVFLTTIPLYAFGDEENTVAEFRWVDDSWHLLLSKEG